MMVISTCTSFFLSYKHVHIIILGRPEVQMVDGSLKYNHETTRLFFAWRVRDGELDSLELMYR